MPLSQNERRVLEQIERDFAADDPALARILSAPARSTRALLAAACCFPVAIALILFAVDLPAAVGVLLAVIAYAVLVESLYVAIAVLRTRWWIHKAGLR